MAAFKDKKNGSWYVQFRYVDWKGERQQKLKRGFATKRDALAWEREFLMQKQADINMTFESFVALYERDIKPKLKLNTWLTKESIIHKKILPYFKNRKLSEISPKDIIAWQNEIRELTDSKGKQFADRHDICLLLVHHTRKQQADDKFDMISGTNGLLGAADGAFLLQKEKRTDNTATLDISGRDQQDQRLYLTRDLVRLVWNLERKETDLWREPPDPLLEAVAALVTESNPEWNGTPTELVAALALDIKPNVLTMRLNVTATRLSNEYGICYESSRSHAGRKITLTLQDAEA